MRLRKLRGLRELGGELWVCYGCGNVWKSQRPTHEGVAWDPPTKRGEELVVIVVPTDFSLPF
jgi:hypothetical protein